MQMDSANLPSQADLNGLYGAWNPMSYMQGQQNQDLAGQFRQQAFDANNNTVQEGQLKNQQSAAMNPLLLQSQQLGNTSTDLGNQGKQIGNQSAGLDLASKQDAFGDKQSLLHSQLAREMSDEDLTTEGNKYLQLYQKAKLAGDDDATQKYGSVLDTLVGTASAKAADRIQQRQLAELSTISKGQIAQGEQQTQRDIAGATIEGRSNVANIGAKAREDAAAMHMGLANEIRTEYAKPPGQRDMQKIQDLSRLAQTLTPGWAGGAQVGPSGLSFNVPNAANSPPQAGTTSSGAKYTITPTGQ